MRAAVAARLQIHVHFLVGYLVYHFFQCFSAGPQTTDGFGKCTYDAASMSFNNANCYARHARIVQNATLLFQGSRKLPPALDAATMLLAAASFAA